MIDDGGFYTLKQRIRDGPKIEKISTSSKRGEAMRECALTETP